MKTSKKFFLLAAIASASGVLCAQNSGGNASRTNGGGFDSSDSPKGSAIYSKLPNVKVKTGEFMPSWSNLAAWECPEWFQDVKFGVWAHWDPQSEAAGGDWYARGMYFKGGGNYNWQVQRYGDPCTPGTDFGYKDLCNAWKADKWDPEALIGLYKDMGARYFFAMGQHHDNFDCWDSPYQPWNSVNIGPKRDMVGDWAKACEKYGLPLGVSMHGSHAWTFFEVAQPYDGNLTLEDGKGKWWEGFDPQELYAQRHEPSRGWQESGTIHSQWNWQNGVSMPSIEYRMKFQNRVLQCVDKYKPAMLYFDDTVLPFYGCDESVGLNILAHAYNTNPEMVVTGKILEPMHKEAMLWDVERGVPDKIQEKPWQTCTCIGGWHYGEHDYRAGYKSAQQVVDMLVDIVSKNGNLLLSIPLKGDGTHDDKEMRFIAEMKAWMDQNSRSIYGTRPWKTFGEGPLADSAKPLNAQGFNESNDYSGRDVRYVIKNAEFRMQNAELGKTNAEFRIQNSELIANATGKSNSKKTSATSKSASACDTLFATILRWPSESTFTFSKLGRMSEYYSGEPATVELLGYGKVKTTMTNDGLVVQLPEKATNAIAPVFAITFKAGSDRSMTLPKLISCMKPYAGNADQLAPLSNTGQKNLRAASYLARAIEEAKKHLGDSADGQQKAAGNLRKAYAEFKKNAVTKAGPRPAGGTDITKSVLINNRNFARTSDTRDGRRFGKPENWEVKNFNIPNGDDGTKQGIDGYQGTEALMLGVWNDRNRADRSTDLSQASITRTVRLQPGQYYLGARFNTVYNLSDDAYLFARTASYPDLPTADLPKRSIAWARLNEANERGEWGITFTLDHEQEVVLGFQADLTQGSPTQEFRATEISLIKY